MIVLKFTSTVKKSVRLIPLFQLFSRTFVFLVQTLPFSTSGNLKDEQEAGTIKKASAANIPVEETRYLRPQTWISIWLPYKMHPIGAISMTSCLSRERCISGAAITETEQCKLDILITTISAKTFIEYVVLHV